MENNCVITNATSKQIPNFFEVNVCTHNLCTLACCRHGVFYNGKQVKSITKNQDNEEIWILFEEDGDINKVDMNKVNSNWVKENFEIILFY